MRKALIAILMLVTSVSALAQSATFKRATRVPLNHEMLYISQVVTADYKSTMTVKVGYISFSNGIMSTSRGSIYAKNSESFKPMPALKEIVNPTAGRVKSAANLHMNYFASSFVPDMSAYMKKNNIAQGWFSFRQIVPVVSPTGTTNETLSWSAFISNYGDASTLSYGSPVLTSSNPTIIQAVYANLKVKEGLPSEWQFAGAGEFRYRILDASFNPLSDWIVAASGGPFDQPVAGTAPGGTAGTEYDWGISCIVSNKNAGCDPTIMDLRTILEQNGSVMAFLDYTRKLEPTYDENGDVNVILNVTKRQAEQSRCGPVSYVNEGTLGYELKTTSERYYVSPNLEYSLIGSSESKQMSPTKSYNKQISISKNDYIKTDLSKKIITPEDGKLNLIDTSSIKIASLAALTEIGEYNNIVGMLIQGSGSLSFLSGCSVLSITCPRDTDKIKVTYGYANGQGNSCGQAAASPSFTSYFSPGSSGNMTLPDGSTVGYNGANGITVAPTTTQEALAENPISPETAVQMNLPYSINIDRGNIANPNQYNYNVGFSKGCNNNLCGYDCALQPGEIVSIQKINSCNDWGWCSESSLCYVMTPSFMGSMTFYTMSRPYGNLIGYVTW